MTIFKVTQPRRRLLPAILLLALTADAAAGADVQHTGKVVAVADGDTVTILTVEKKQVKIRLAEIDAPEKSQAFGNQSKKSLSDLVFGKVVHVMQQDIDRYGRVVGRIYIGHLDVSAEQVRRGMAWVFRTYSKDASFIAIEADAQKAKRGLWADAHPIAPWDYRRRGKAQRVGNDASVIGVKSGGKVAPGEFECGTKTKCGEMESCAEARYFLESCGLTRLDGDKDGKPCESICR